ncbi:MAG: acyl-CoA dehydrogenase family protein [Planctomycetota bacterium]
MARHIDRYLKEILEEDRFSFYQTVCDFADEEIGKHILQWEREHLLMPDDCLRKMGELGLFGLTVEEAYGGQGGDLLDLVLMGLAVGYHSPSAAITPGAATSLGINPIHKFGSPAQKKEHLPDLTAGKRMAIFGLSEPGRGSDAANPEVLAIKTNGGYLLNKEKCWSTNAKWASHIVVHAMTDSTQPNGHRTTCFLVPMNRKGIHYQEMQGKTVWEQSSTGSVVFENVFASSDEILGEYNDGFKVMVTTLNGGRVFIAALALSSLAFALDKCAHYVQERIQFDGPIGRFQRVQDVLLDMDIALEQHLSWLVHLSRLYTQNKLKREQAAKLKISASRVASHLLVDAMEICGGVACLDEFGLMRHHRDLFVTRVGEGSNFALKTLAVKPLLPNISIQ